MTTTRPAIRANTPSAAMLAPTITLVLSPESLSSFEFDFEPELDGLVLGGSVFGVSAGGLLSAGGFVPGFPWGGFVPGLFWGGKPPPGCGDVPGLGVIGGKPPPGCARLFPPGGVPPPLNGGVPPPGFPSTPPPPTFGPEPGMNVVPVKMAPQLGQRVANWLTFVLHREQKYSNRSPPMPPEKPEIPETPETPATPETPETPATPEKLFGIPVNPAPEIPENPAPGLPAKPPGMPVMPAPGLPEKFPPGGRVGGGRNWAETSWRVNATTRIVAVAIRHHRVWWRAREVMLSSRCGKPGRRVTT